MPSSACKTKKIRSEEHTSELQSHDNLLCRLLLEKKRTGTRRWTARVGRGRRRHRDTRLPARYENLSNHYHLAASPAPLALPPVSMAYFFKDAATPGISPLSPPAAFPT